MSNSNLIQAKGKQIKDGSLELEDLPVPGLANALKYLRANAAGDGHEYDFATLPQIVNVATSGADFTSIAAAAASISDASSTKPYVVLVAPGVYTEPLIALPSYVSVVGFAINSVVVQPDGNHHVFTMSPLSELLFLTIRGNGSSGKAGIAVLDSGDFAQVHKVSIYDCDISVLVNSATVNTVCYLEYVDCNTFTTNALCVEATNGFIAKCNAENFYTYADNTFTGRQVKVSGIKSEIHVMSAGFVCANNHMCFHALNGAYLAVSSSYIEDAFVGIHSEVLTTGTNTLEIIAVDFDDCTTNVKIDDVNTTGHLTGYSAYEKNIIPLAAPFFITGKDPKKIIVSAKGGDFTSVAAAIASITDNSSTNRYLIHVEPGDFSEPPFTIGEGISVTGDTAHIPQLTASNTGADFITMAGKSDIENIMISGAGTGYAGIVAAASTSSSQIHMSDIHIKDCDIGIKLDSTSAERYVEITNVEITGSFSYGYSVKSGGTNKAKLQTTNTHLTTSKTSGTCVKVDGPYADVVDLSAVMKGTKLTSTGKGVHITDGAKWEGLNVELENCDVGLYIENTGAAPKIVGTALTIYQNNTYDVQVVHPTATGVIQGVMTASLMTIPDTATINVSFASFDTATPGSVTVGELYQGTTLASRIRLSNLARESATLGLVYPASCLSKGSGLVTNVAAGYGYLLDANGDIKEVSWDATTVTGTSSTNKFVLVDEDGVVFLSAADGDGETTISLGSVYYTSTNHYLANTAVDASHYANDLARFFRNVMGCVYETGSVVVEYAAKATATITITNNTLDTGDKVTVNGVDFIETTHFTVGADVTATAANLAAAINASADVLITGILTATSVAGVVTLKAVTGGPGGNSLTLAETDGATNNFTISGATFANGTNRALDITAGARWFNGRRYTSVGSSITGGHKTYEPHRRNGSGGWTHAGSTTIAVPNDKYDDNSGTLATVGAGLYTKHSLYVVDEGADEKYGLVHSQQTYSTQQEAENGPLPAYPPEFREIHAPIASFVMQQGVDSIVTIMDERNFLGAGGGSVASSVSDHGGLTGLADDDHPQYLLGSGSRSMSGSLNMGTYNITNVGTVDGVDVSTHESRHLPNGADPVTTAAAVSITTANSEGTANSLARSDHGHRGVSGYKVDSGTARYGEINLVSGYGMDLSDDGAGNVTVTAVVATAQLIPSIGTGLNIDYTAGNVLINGAYSSLIAGSLSVPLNVTDYWMFVNTSAVMAYAATLPAGAHPVAQFTTNGSAVTSVSDRRTWTNRNMVFGTAAGTMCEGNDARLSDSRTPSTLVYANSPAATTTSATPASLIATATNPAAGTYLVSFTGDFTHSTSSASGTFRVYVGGATYTGALPLVVARGQSQGNVRLGVPLTALVTVNGSQNVAVYWSTSGATATVTNRTLVLVKVG